MRRAFAPPGNTRSLVASLSSRRARTNGQFKKSQPQLQSQWQYGPNSDLFARDETKTIMSIERQSKLRSGPPIVPADPAMEREQLIAADRAFEVERLPAQDATRAPAQTAASSIASPQPAQPAAALKQALQSGAETSA